jgi:leucyl-tRNA synthetase
MGPLDVTKPWQTAAVPGMRRFLERAWRLVCDEEGGVSARLTDAPLDEQLRRLQHKTVRAVTEDIEHLRFNTAIARLMEFANALTPLERRPRAAVEAFVLLLAPLAPHLGEELWSILDHDRSLAYAPWPIFDPDLARDDAQEYVIQVNGKIRHKIVASADMTADMLLALVKADPKVKDLLTGKTILKEIAVPGRLVNFVVRD